MARLATDIVQHDFGFPRRVRAEAEERSSLHHAGLGRRDQADGRAADAGFSAPWHGLPGDRRFRSDGEGDSEARSRSSMSCGRGIASAVTELKHEPCRTSLR
jgi:hypothetical protein